MDEAAAWPAAAAVAPRVKHPFAAAAGEAVNASPKTPKPAGRPAVVTGGGDCAVSSFMAAH